MEKLITIPCSLDKIDDYSKVSIDMSNLQFDCDNDKKKFYAFIFIRNTGIKSNLNFDKCSFYDKEEYIKMFLTLNIELKCSILASTWIEILSFDDNDIYLPCILTKEEIKKFIDRNKKLIDSIHQFINSLPLYSIYKYINQFKINTNDINEFDICDNIDIKLINFYQLTEFDRFILLLNPNPPYEHKPVLYKDLFDNRDNAYDLMCITNKLPYMNFINAIFSDKDCQDNIISRIDKVFKEEE